MQAITFIFLALWGASYAAPPPPTCPVPSAPENGQVDWLPTEIEIKFSCNEGFILNGQDFASCVDGVWIPDTPTCQEIKGKEDSDVDAEFSEKNDSTDGMQADDMRVVWYPQRRRITRIQRIRTETEEDDKKSKKDTSSTHAIYVKGSDKATEDEIAIIEEDLTDGVHVEVAPEPKPVVTDEALRYMYYLAHYMDPAHAQTLFHSAGYPYGYALSENQIAWINNLHPEVRDRYIKDLYNSHVVDDTGRGAHLKDYYNPAHWIYYKNPYYYSTQRLAAIVENTIANYDYSCYQTESDGSITNIKAPALHNAYVYRYDKRRNPNYPQNDYLTAIYRCNPGYALLDYRVDELHCSKRRWIGSLPVCASAL